MTPLQLQSTALYNDTLEQFTKRAVMNSESVVSCKSTRRVWISFTAFCSMLLLWVLELKFIPSGLCIWVSGIFSCWLHGSHFFYEKGKRIPLSLYLVRHLLLLRTSVGQLGPLAGTCRYFLHQRWPVACFRNVLPFGSLWIRHFKGNF